jgi:hypothetical protein
LNLDTSRQAVSSTSSLQANMPADMPAEAGANSWRDKHCPNHTLALSRDTSSSPLAFGS